MLDRASTRKAFWEAGPKKDYCYLPHEYGIGAAKYIEDCETLSK